MMAPTDGQAQACSALLRASLRKQRNIIDRARSSPAAAAQRRRCPGMRRCRRHCAAGTARALPAGTPPSRRRIPCPTSCGRLPAPLTAYVWCKASAACWMVRAVQEMLVTLANSGVSTKTQLVNSTWCPLQFPRSVAFRRRHDVRSCTRLRLGEEGHHTVKCLNPHGRRAGRLTVMQPSSAICMANEPAAECHILSLAPHQRQLATGMPAAAHAVQQTMRQTLA